jgi:3'-phosphoadenosine 5'-phosphosulfate sulfotransferase (PAPS reductase)/FAD synthetase
MKSVEYLLCVSGGNDSIALIQFALDKGLNFACVYNDTGWAKDGWADRIKLMSLWLEDVGSFLYTTKSEGMLNLVRRKKGWPMPASAMQFCTQELKVLPTLQLLDKIDPDKELTCVNGLRREESQNRATAPEWVDESSKHGGRELWSPLVRYTQDMRDALINRTPFSPLPHSSMECWPCVCANKADLKALTADPNRIELIESTEISMGFTSNKKPRTMFRPYRVGGGVGIRQAVEWGCGKRGHKAKEVPSVYRYEQGKMTQGVFDFAYDPETKEGREFARQCEGGFCGS